jgi:4-hydroxy-tetrahydrodipicolinate synthase
MTPIGPLLTAMITPFRESGAVDYDEAVRVAHFLVEQGCDGVVVSGTTGESPALEDEEKLELFRRIKRSLGSSATVVAGTGGNNTRHSTELTKRAIECGVDAILAVVPYYNKPTQDGMLSHFGAIAEASSIPVIVYNIPGRTGANMLPATLLRLAREHATIRGVKESSGDLSQMTQILRDRPAGFQFWSGDDYLYLPSLALGGDGLISVAAHLVAPRYKAMRDAFVAGHVAQAAAIHCELSPLVAALFTTTSPIPVKWAMREYGFAVGPCRSPLGAMPEALMEPLRALIAPYHPASALAAEALAHR